MARVQNPVKEVRSYKDLLVWQKARVLAKTLYEVTALLPQDEKFGLTSQLRRGAVSIPSNIAEGSARRSTKDFIRFINITHGTLCEIETQLYLAVDFEFLGEYHIHTALEQCYEVGRMLNGLQSKLYQKLDSGL